MNEYNPFNPITSSFFEVSNTFPNRCRIGNVSNDVNNFNTNMKHIRHVKKVKVIWLKKLYSFIF